MIEGPKASTEPDDRRSFFDRFNGRYRELRHDLNAWRLIEEERRLDSGVLADSAN